MQQSTGARAAETYWPITDSMDPFTTPSPGSRDRNGESLMPEAQRHEGHFSDVRPDKIGQTYRLFTEYGVCMLYL